MNLGETSLPIPIFLAPMAGVTNAAYRRLCREQAELGCEQRPAGVFTCEMITARGITERIDKTFAMMAPDVEDPIYSVQLYGTDPLVVGKAISIACGEYGVSHIDLNFGCPVPKVTRRGGGGVLPWKLDRFAAILHAAVRAAEPFRVPVTIKTRIGIDNEHLTMFDAGRIAEQAGIAGITLHARTVDQAYSGKARWEAIAELVQDVSIPVIGNGDIWEASDAVRMMAETGCAGVSIGRGVLGRPWLFRDLASALSAGSYALPGSIDRLPGVLHSASSAQDDGVDSFPESIDRLPGVSPPHKVSSLRCGTLRGPRVLPGGRMTTGVEFGGEPRGNLPSCGEVAVMVRRHAELLVIHFGDERHAMADLRKHMAWYFKGFSLGGELRYALGLVSSLAELDDILARLDLDEEFPEKELHSPRGRQGSPRTKVAMPYNWLTSRTLDNFDLTGADLDTSGG
ncbi:MAG: tRNA-dihydrouridine synthase [Propionibacteriaceae bacterium]|nr:tRNA-dihydrouridine synthase [Propionibacteriaceae bacterium]